MSNDYRDLVVRFITFFIASDVVLRSFALLCSGYQPLPFIARVDWSFDDLFLVYWAPILKGYRRSMLLEGVTLLLMDA